MSEEFDKTKEKNRNETMKHKKLEVDRIREGTRMTTEKSFSLQKLHKRSCKIWQQNAPSGKCACG